MDFRDRIRRLLAEMNLTEWELAARLGLHRGAIVRMLAAGRQPEPIECLLLAGFQSATPDREYWLDQSGIDGLQRQLLAKAVGSPEMDLTSFPPELGADLATFLDFMANAHPERRKAVQAILRDWRSDS
jgi:hypothetical protein